MTVSSGFKSKMDVAIKIRLPILKSQEQTKREQLQKRENIM